MLQCLEWEPSGSFNQKHSADSKENNGCTDHSGASGLIEMNLAMGMTDLSMPSNPRKAILYRSSVTHLIAVGPQSLSSKCVYQGVYISVLSHWN